MIKLGGAAWVALGVAAGLAAAVAASSLRGAGGPQRPVSPGAAAGAAQDASAVPDRPGPAQAAGAYASFLVPEFSLVGVDGAPVTQAVFDGRHTIVQFFFTACPGPCPATTRIMADAQSRARASGLRLVSISVDGGRDTPERVRDYAAGFGADESVWTFLTGPEATVQALLREGLGYTLRRDAADLITDRDGTRFANILHPTQVMLIGPDRRVIDLAVYTDEAGVERVVAEGVRRAGAGGRP
jgi:cytochrome oxidase Cu insertion factor (SCO1/SenC/PrrC family)